MAIRIIAEVIITVLIKADHLATEPPAEVLRTTVIAAEGLLLADKMPDHILTWDHDKEFFPRADQAEYDTDIRDRIHEYDV